ncbi:maleylacetate reductase [Yoonia vestfoldensis]|uniref:maleylacetate reductase n=1 Tax=Yoonia vestfoldensis TaxID=245188 RepID=UPI000366CB95|nr:maleylacetate reductase [Yoonia vestfoldensis]
MIHPRAFVFPGIATKVIFGHGTLAQVGDAVRSLGRGKALVLSTPQQADQARDVVDRLGALAAGTFTEAAMHTPVDVTDRAVAAYQAAGADCVVAIGGGSTTGLGKAIAVRTSADQVVIPTTYAGSEMTDILGETDKGEKTTRRDPAIRPELVIYDVDLTLGLPVSMTVTSALNAIAHAVEGLYAADANPITDMMALESIRAFKRGLPEVVADPANTEARAEVLYGAWLGSTTLGYVSMALHHKLCHVLGGSFGLPHAETHAIMLPHTAGFNAIAVPEQLRPVAELMGGTVGGGLWDFAKALGAPLRLSDLGLEEPDLDRAAEIATRQPYANPRKFTRDDIKTILTDAWRGTRSVT